MTLTFALAYARMNQQQRDATQVVVGPLEWECLRVLADEIDRLKALQEKPECQMPGGQKC